MDPKKIIGGLLLGAVILWLIGTMASNQHRSQAAESAPPPPTDKWQISESRPQMDDSKTVVLALDSDDEIHGPLGAVRPSLIIRCEEKKTSVYVMTGMAANLETDSDGGPSDDHKVRIRLDDNSANYASWLESTDHKALFAQDLYYGDRLESLTDFAKKL